MKDYHARPVLAARVRPDSKEWAREEAERRGMGVGEFLDTILDAERTGQHGSMIFIRHVVGRCPHCGSPILDCGYSDDPALWEHAWTGASSSG